MTSTHADSDRLVAVVRTVGIVWMTMILSLTGGPFPPLG